MIKRIHVNQHIIKSNHKNGENKPALTIKMGGKTHNAHEVEILGPSSVIYRPNKPLSCGARCWIETHSEVNLIVDHGDAFDELRYEMQENMIDCTT